MNIILLYKITADHIGTLVILIEHAIISCSIFQIDVI